MAEPVFNYDEPSDTLYVSFAPGVAATGIELNDHILLRIDKTARRVIGLTLLDYSLLAQQTEVGPRSFPLTGLAALPSELREFVLELLRTPPVSSILTLTAYTPTMAEVVPAVSLQPLAVAVG